MFRIFVFSLLTIYTSPQPIILGGCSDEEFQCDDGVCIPKAWQCDYEIDCANKEDELFDTDGNECVPCVERGFFCEDDTNKCIPPQWHCDGWTDCKNGNDEIYCTACADTQFTCNSGACIDIDLLCDSNDDCVDGEDEIHDISGNNCTACDFQCDSNTLCLSRDKLCDGQFDCVDKSDECDATLCATEQRIITECDTISTTTTTHAAVEQTEAENEDTDHTPNWKYCPSDIVWLGFINTFQSNHNTTAVYWIEPKVREEGIYYDKYSTSYNSGDFFSIGMYSIQYIAKKSSNITNEDGSNETDDPIFCVVRLLVLDGMRDYEIAACEAQTHNDYIEWELVVDDSSYSIAYFTIGEYETDIVHARFVPMEDKFYTDCYAQIAFETGIMKSEEEVVIEETVHWMSSHLYALIGFIVAVVLLFCILLIVIIILWRKHVEMKEFIRADTTDIDEDSQDESIDDGECAHMLDTKRASTIDLDVTTPGGIEYITGNQMPYIMTSKYGNNYNGARLNVSNVNDSSDSDDDDVIHGLNLKQGQRKRGNITPPRRPSILGIDYDQLKEIQKKARKEQMEHDADVLLENEWDKESEISQGL